MGDSKITTTSSRRVFLARGIAVSAIAAAPLTALGRAPNDLGNRGTQVVDGVGGEQANDAGLPFALVFDRDAAAGPAFAAAAAGFGSRATAIGSDVGTAWRDLIEPRLRRGAIAIAGLTAGAPLFCLELLARDYGLRPVFRIEHAIDASGRYRHTCEVPAALSTIDAGLAFAADWGAAAATLAASCRLGPDRNAPLALLDVGGRPGRAMTYFTWRLAPSAVGPRHGNGRRAT